MPDAGRLDTTLHAGEPEMDELIAQRYRLARRLGHGGHGEVWEAVDVLGGDRVAVKLIKREGLQAARIRREVAALRLLRIPGIVRLLDEGVHDGRPFLVMECIDGQPFPGIEWPARWEAIAERTRGLLETIARIHAAGIVHRDLKPANVLVDAAGRAVVLDFGLSVGTPLGAGVTGEGMVMGTPAYLAPEQLYGDPVGPWTDLYSTGLLLYEALSGRRPHATDDARALMRARLGQRPRPLGEVAPEVPARVAQVVDLLLAIEPANRPRSAEEVLAMLGGERPEVATRRLLAHVGSPSIAELEALAGRGASIDVVGAPGTGRTRCLGELARGIERGGATVAWTTAGQLPFQSLEPVLGPLPADVDVPLADVEALVQDRLRETTAGGVTLIIDDAERVDRWSAAAIARARAEGLRVVRALLEPRGDPPSRSLEPARGEAAKAAAVVELAPLPESALRALFRGPDRIFHLAEDGARALFERTGGVASRVAEELAAWERAGLARIAEGRVTVDRGALDRLGPGGPGARALSAAARARDGGREPTPRAADQLAWLRLAWPHTAPDLLARAESEPLWRVEAELADLLEAGLARRTEDGRVQALAGGEAAAAWTTDRLAAAHRALARLLAPGADARLLHLVAAHDDADEGATAIAEEACVFALRVAEEGQLGRAIAALGEGMLALGRAEASIVGVRPAIDAARARVLSVWAEVALADGTPGALDRVLYEICRIEPRRGLIADLERLVRAGLEDAWKGEGVAEHLAGVAPFDDPDLERWRHLLRVKAARRHSVSEEARLLGELEGWSGSSEEATASLLNWRGSARYREGRFEEAAALHDEAARRARWLTARLSARLNGASALLEAFRYDDAAAWAREARDVAAGCRHAFFEARAEWILRSVAYRTGRAGDVDDELVEAVERLGIADYEGLVRLNEAAVAWRLDRHEHALVLAERAARRFSDAGNRNGAIMAEALVQIERPQPAALAALVERAAAYPVASIRVQVLGLLARAGARVPDAPRAQLGLEAEVPRRHWALRMDLVSVDEALSWIAG